MLLHALVRFLCLLALPAAPTGVRVSDITPRSTQLQWTAPQPRNGPVINAEPQYVIQYKSSETEEWMERGEDEIETETSYILSGLLPYTLYELRIVPYIKYGRGTPSQPIQFRTHETG